MQTLTVLVSESFICRLSRMSLSPIRIIPKIGYYYKHHFVVKDINYNSCTLTGLIGSASSNEIFGDVIVSYDGEFEEIAKVLL